MNRIGREQASRVARRLALLPDLTALIDRGKHGTRRPLVMVVCNNSTDTLDRGLTHLADQPYTQVSGGERQLALIGRALCQEPRILLLGGKVALLRDGTFVAYGAAARELTSDNLQRTYDMDIEVASAYVPRLGRSVSVVVPVIETARPEGSGAG